jgi:hypothetical protein
MQEWETVYLIASFIHFVGVVFYAIFASGEQQPWAEPPPSAPPTDKKLSVDADDDVFGGGYTGAELKLDVIANNYGSLSPVAGANPFVAGEPTPVQPAVNGGVETSRLDGFDHVTGDPVD